MKNNGDVDELLYCEIFSSSEYNMRSWTSNMFLTFCILSGCDYLDQIPQVGNKTAYQLVHNYKNYKRILDFLRIQNKYVIPMDYEKNFVKAFLTFKFQFVYCPIQNAIINLNQVRIEEFTRAIEEYSTFSILELSNQFHIEVEMLDMVKSLDFEFLGKKYEDLIGK